MMDVKNRICSMLQLIYLLGLCALTDNVGNVILYLYIYIYIYIYIYKQAIFTGKINTVLFNEGAD